MKEISKLFIPSLKSLRSVFYETSNTSISRERFIDFLKTVGLLLLVINSFSFLDINYSGGEYLIINNSLMSKCGSESKSFSRNDLDDSSIIRLYPF